MAEKPVTAVLVEGLDALPGEARALFGGDAFSSWAWYDSVSRAALPAGSRAGAILVRRGGDLLAVVPVRLDATGLSALTTPYTVAWSPLLRPGLAWCDTVTVGAACGRLWRRWPLTRLDAVDGEADWFAPFLAGLRRSGLATLRFDHFGNWRENVAGLGWDAYLAARPGALRGTIARRGKRLTALGAAFELVEGPDGLEEALSAYETIYAASWKQSEPYPGFPAALMRAAAQDGGLRLGVLRLGSAPVAAQFWLVHSMHSVHPVHRCRHGGWAGVQKLAHDEAHRALAPGTVLTGLMIRHLLDHDGVTELDFGRGDDAYKRDWVGERRQRIGVMLAAPWRVRGLAHMLRHAGGRLARLVR